MKVVYQICCGVDVHKSFLVATIIKTTKGVQPSYQKKRFSTFNSDILHFKQWLLDNDCLDVCMESTGKYWVLVFNLLEDCINVTIANPKWVKAIKGNKDDSKDSKWIGDLFRLALDSVVSDMFGKSASAITDYLISSDVFDASICTSFLQKSLKKKEEAVVDSIEGYQMADSQKERMLLVRSHLDFVQNTIDTLDSKLNILVAPYQNAISLLCTIPGVDKSSAITILSEIGTDMSQFNYSKRLCCWAGLTPGNNESAGKKKSVRITRAGVYLKPALVQCAHATARSTATPYYKSKYERLSKRRGKKRSIIAIARMILTAAYHMLSTGEIWNPCDLFKIDMPYEMQEKQKAKAINQAIKLLVAKGLIPPDPITVPVA